MQTQKLNNHKILWQVALSDGSNYKEGQGLFQEIEGELSPWQKLLVYLEKNFLQITSLVLVTEDNRYFSLPSAGNNPKFRPFRLAEKPLNYKVEHYVAREAKVASALATAPVDEWFTVAVAIYPNYKLQLWVSEIDSRKCWTLVVPESI